MASTQLTQPPRRSRRAIAAVFAGVLLIVGVGLLSYSLFVREDQAAHSSASPSLSPVMSPSPMAFTAPAVTTPSPGASTYPVIVYTTHTDVPTYVTAPAPPAEGPDVLGLVTTFSGLLASIAGVISAVVSIRSSRPR